MSWGTIACKAPLDGIVDALKRARDEYTERIERAGTVFEPEAVEQMDAAIAAAATIAATGACGTFVQVNLHGHANPQHQPRTGWAADNVAVNVWSSEAEPVFAEVAPIDTPAPNTAPELVAV